MLIRDQIDEFVDLTPREHRDDVTGFLLYHYDPGLFQLCKSDPCLVLMMTYCDRFTYCEIDPWDYAGQWVGAKRGNILHDLLEFPSSSESAARVIRKLNSKHTTVDDLLKLRDMFYTGGEKLKMLRHIRCLTGAEVRIIHDDELIECTNIHDLTWHAWFRTGEEYASILRHVHKVAAETNIPLRIFKKKKGAEEFYKKDQHLLNQVEWESDYDDHVFPDSPLDIPSWTIDEGIRLSYIETPRALYRAARDFRCCAMQYVNEVFFGISAFYRVYEPAPVLIRFEHNSDDTWVMKEYLGPYNRHISRDLKFRLAAVFNKYQPSTKKGIESDVA